MCLESQDFWKQVVGDVIDDDYSNDEGGTSLANQLEILNGLCCGNTAWAPALWNSPLKHGQVRFSWPTSF